MVQTPVVIATTSPRNVQETINWLIRLGRPPLPECPIEAAKQGKEPKQPCFLDGKYLKTVNWKQWQNTQPIEEIYKAWFQNPKTGIGTLGGWNGKHWLGWIDFDQKDFASGEECDGAIANWLEQYPLMKDAPMFRTPNGGYRFLVAFNSEPENFKANSGFSLKPDGSHHVGELLSKNGGHTLLPPTVGVSGKAYQWMQWSEYPPVVEQPEDVGLYPVQKKTASVQPLSQPIREFTGDSSTDLLNREIIPRLSLESAFSWHGHDFKQSGSKLKGNCPWHDSQSGTSFYAEIKNGSLVWRCPACEIGGSVIEYRHRLAGGNGSPRGSEFRAIVKELASEVGVSVPEFRSTTGGDREKRGNSTNLSHISLRDAIEKASQILEAEISSQLDSIEASILLEELRREAGVNEYNWEQKYLKPIREKLERSLVLPDATSQPAQIDPDERLRLDLLALIKESDPIKKVRKKAEIASHYSISKGEIEFLCRTLEGDSKISKAQFYALDDFLNMESDGIDYLIPGLLPRGETVLCAGLPKSGKTLLAIDAGFAIATGETHFLGEQVSQGKVLLISVDESAQSTKAKLIKRGFRARDAGSLAVMTAWDIGQLDVLEAKLEDFRPDLVIIDSLKRITAGREISENSAEFADVLYTLKELMGRYGAASILIHHSNKNSEATGVSRVRGSTAIAGAVWGIWQMDIPEAEDDSEGKPSKGKKQKRFDPTNPNRIFTAICRDTEGALLNIRFNPENHSYSISEGDQGAQSERKTQEQTILDILAQVAPNGLTGREVMEYSGLGRGVYSVLNRMVDKRLITHRQSKTDSRMTVYCLPKSKGTPPPSHSYPDCDQYSPHPITGKELEIDHKLITTTGIIDHNFEGDRTPAINPNPQPVNQPVEIDHKNTNKRGGGVSPNSGANSDTELITKKQYSDTPATEQEKYAAANVDEQGWGEVVREVANVAPIASPLPEKPRIEVSETTQLKPGDRVTILTGNWKGEDAVITKKVGNIYYAQPEGKWEQGYFVEEIKLIKSHPNPTDSIDDENYEF